MQKETIKVHQCVDDIEPIEASDVWGGLADHMRKEVLPTDVEPNMHGDH